MSLEKWTNKDNSKEMIVNFNDCTLTVDGIVASKRLEIKIEDILNETQEAITNGLIGLTLCDLRAIAWYEGLRPIEYSSDNIEIKDKIKEWVNSCWNKCKYKNDYFTHMNNSNKEKELNEAKIHDLTHCNISSSICTETVIGQMQEGVELITPEN